MKGDICELEGAVRQVLADAVEDVSMCADGTKIDTKRHYRTVLVRKER